MMLLWIAVLLPSLILATDTNWQYQIYVSSSDGTNSSSCWNGSVPCNTLNLALQGVQHNSTVIYLYPGIYTLDDEVRNISRVAIIGLSDDVTISCHHQPVTGQWLDNVIFHCITFYFCPTTISNSIPCPYNVTKSCDYCEGDNDKLHINVLDSLAYPGNKITFTAFLYDRLCSDRKYIESNLTVCIVSGPESVKLCSTNSNCTNTSINSLNQYSFSICYFGKEMTYGSTIDIDVEISTEPDVSTNTTIKVRPYCYGSEVYNDITGKCEYTYSPCYSGPIYMYTNTCAPGTAVSLCGSCEDGYSVPINLPNKCVQCDPLIGWILFVTVQLLPVTVMVLLIIVLNIQLTSGTFNALVFYSQILTTVYPGLTYNSMFGHPSCYNNYILYFYKLFLIPLNIFNLDFTLFLGDYPLCISSATTPLGAVSFRYVIGLHPLVLLLLLYVWITLYNKGYKVIVLITRPIHRLLARFWSMTNIEPSLPHSIASIYLLCFMQLAATSFNTILLAIGNSYYNSNIWSRCLAGIFAILVLILLVLIPMLYIQMYPFKLHVFRKLLRCLHLNKLWILRSLGDIFTGPYKNGATNKLDYRYFAGFYLLLRIIIFLSHFIPNLRIISALQVSIFGLFCGVIGIFRPYQKNVNNFNVFFIFLLLVILNLISAVDISNIYAVIIVIVLIFDVLFFVIIMFPYFIYWTVKKIRSCYGYLRPLLESSPPAINDTDTAVEETKNGNDWTADRMINPQDYDEQHSSVAPYELQEICSNENDKANN